MFDIQGNKFRSGIYQIYNKLTDKRYIGSSINIPRRLAQHRWYLRNNKHHNKHLQSAWNKYGESEFIFEALEYCEPELLLKTEHDYIVYYNACDRQFGYNVVEDVEKIHMRPTDESLQKISKKSKGRKWTEEQRAKFIKSRTGKKNKEFSERLKQQFINGERSMPRFDNVSKEKLEEWCRNISIGRKKHFENCDPVIGRPIKVTTEDACLYFASLRAASKYLGICVDSVRNAAKGIVKPRKTKYNIQFASIGEYNANT